MSGTPNDVERSVRERYSQAAGERTAELCCPVDYDPRYLNAIPAEIIERDYGCGDPSRHIRPGETVLDLGSGGGKICFIASQVVGPEGQVIGVDMNDEMLALAETHRVAFGDRIGHHNVRFLKGKIQDLATDPAALQTRLENNPVRTPADIEALELWRREQRTTRPLVADGSVDVIVSNCVLNLVDPDDKQQLFREMHRVLRAGGRAVISDIVSDESIPTHLQNDPELWSGCISGAYREDGFLEAFAEAGFYGMRVLSRGEEPWRTVEGIEFRSVTVEAFRGSSDPCLERNQGVIYRGPWRTVTDDDGHTLHRGVPMAICDRTHATYSREPYVAELETIPPRTAIPPDAAAAFECGPGTRRDPRVTKGADYRASTDDASTCCGPGKDSCG